MTPFDGLIDDVGDDSTWLESGAVAAAGPPTDYRPSGGIDGFLSQLSSAGLGSTVSSWLGNSAGAPLTSQQVESALGHSAIDGLASKLGLGTGVVSGADRFPAAQSSSACRLRAATCRPEFRPRYLASSESARVRLDLETNPGAADGRQRTANRNWVGRSPFRSVPARCSGPSFPHQPSPKHRHARGSGDRKNR
jgi:hypothetical protein